MQCIMPVAMLALAKSLKLAHTEREYLEKSKDNKA